MWAILFLAVANIFMTFAWYGHLKWFKDGQAPLWKIIILSWGIALAEYCFQVPANRIGFQQEGFSLAQLKTMQEILTLVAFTLFSIFVMKQPFKWNYGVGFVLLFVAAFFIFNDWK